MLVVDKYHGVCIKLTEKAAKIYEGAGISLVFYKMEHNMYEILFDDLQYGTMSADVCAYCSSYLEYYLPTLK